MVFLLYLLIKSDSMYVNFFNSFFSRNLLVFSVAVTFILSFPTLIFASTVYQQLTDSSGFISVPFTSVCSSSVVVGTFTTDSTSHIMGGGVGYVYLSNELNVGNTNVILGVSSTSDACGNLASILYTVSQSGSGETTSYFGNFSSATLSPNSLYYVTVLNGGSNPVKFVSNFSSHFFFGYLTDKGNESLPVSPGIPGFSNTGISTTSQQRYCYQNFSTSTGFLSVLSQDISLGFCNTAVFLFVPSTDSFQSLESLSSSTSTHFPFSWFYGTVFLFQSLEASSSQMVNWVIPFHSLGLGSSTVMGNFLPDVTILSSSTITTYIGLERWESLQFLIVISLYLGLVFGFYKEVKFISAKHH